MPSSALTSSQVCQDAELYMPPDLHAEGGVLSVTLDVVWVNSIYLLFLFFFFSGHHHQAEYM